MGEKRRGVTADVVPIAKRLQQSADLNLIPKKNTDDIEDKIKQLEAQLESSDSSSEESDDENDELEPAIVNLSAYQNESVPALPAEMLPKVSFQSSKVHTSKDKTPAPKIVGKVPFACKPCGFVGKDIEDFKRHRVSPEHQEIVKVPLSCKLCSKEFTSAEQLAEHKKGKWHQMRKRTKKEHFQAPARRVCYDFLRGNCFRGDSCSFDHDETASDPNQKKHNSIQKPTRKCNQFESGSCKFGDKCIFSHAT